MQWGRSPGTGELQDVLYVCMCVCMYVCMYVCVCMYVLVQILSKYPVFQLEGRGPLGSPPPMKTSFPPLHIVTSCLFSICVNTQNCQHYFFAISEFRIDVSHGLTYPQNGSGPSPLETI